MTDEETKPRETLYALVDRLGPVEVGRQLGEHHSTITRARVGATDVKTELLRACSAVWGDAFDAEGSALEWYRARLARPVRPATESTDSP